MQKPTVGRVVHYYSQALGSYGHNGQGAGPYAAIVVQVSSDDFINLFVLDPFEIRLGHYEGSVTEQAITPGRYWEWPPRESAAVLAVLAD